MSRWLLLSSLVVLASCGSSDRLSRMAGLETDQMITLSEAIDVAAAEVPDGFVIEAVLEVEDDDENEPPAYEVVLYVRAEEQLIEVEVDAFSGEVLEVEVGEDDGEDDGAQDD